jgi:hypothetical protein
MNNSWVTHLIDPEDGSGDLILQFPDELLNEKGWKEGTVLNLKVEETPTGSVIIVTEKK